MAADDDNSLMMKKSNSVNPIIMILITLAMIILIVLGILVFIPFFGKSSNTETVQQGVQFLQEQEHKDISGIDAELHRQTALEDTEGMDLWEKLNFYDTYIMGDSRCEPFFWSGLQMEHVWAEKSATIKYIGEHIEEIAAARPGNLVLSFGMNDMGMYVYDPENYWETADDYVEAYDYYVSLIREASPDTNVYINSIIPVLDVALESQPRWAAVDEWNAALQEYCSENDVGYIDTAYITYMYGDLFDDDGVHFYSQTALDSWGETILEEVENRVYR